jgi:hypothetical protein
VFWEKVAIQFFNNQLTKNLIPVGNQKPWSRSFQDYCFLLSCSKAECFRKPIGYCLRAYFQIIKCFKLLVMKTPGYSPSHCMTLAESGLTDIFHLFFIQQILFDFNQAAFLAKHSRVNSLNIDTIESIIVWVTCKYSEQYLIFVPDSTLSSISFLTKPTSPPSSYIDSHLLAVFMDFGSCLSLGLRVFSSPWAS